MFILSDVYRFSWPATALVPDVAQPGQVVKQHFQLSFEAMSRDGWLAVVQAASDGGSDANYEFLLRVIKGWDQVISAENEPVPFSEETLHQAMQFRWFRDAAFSSYHEAMSGEAARLGN